MLRRVQPAGSPSGHGAKRGGEGLDRAVIRIAIGVVHAIDLVITVAWRLSWASSQVCVVVNCDCPTLGVGGASSIGRSRARQLRPGDGRWLLLGGSGEREASVDKRSHVHFIECVHDDVCTSGGQQVDVVPASDADRAHPARLGRLHPSTCILHHD